MNWSTCPDASEYIFWAESLSLPAPDCRVSVSCLEHSSNLLLHVLKSLHVSFTRFSWTCYGIRIQKILNNIMCRTDLFFLLQHHLLRQTGIRIFSWFWQLSTVYVTMNKKLMEINETIIPSTNKRWSTKYRTKKNKQKTKNKKTKKGSKNGLS